MKKVLSLLTFIVFALFVHAQDTTFNKALADELIAMLDSLEAPKSYVNFSLGIGNRSFSVNNNSVNASQSQVNKLYYTPSIGYFHKSGFGISVSPYLTVENGSLKNYQTAITPSFDYESNKIAAGISFTKFITDTKSYTSNSTYQNDLYTYLKYTKSYIQPILMVGYSSGKFNDISYDSVFGPPPNYRLLAIKKDSTKNVVKDFSVSLGIEHTFTIDSLFSKNAYLTFTPQLVLNAGSEKFTSTITNTRRVTNATRNNRLKSLTLTDNAAFAFQSIALSLSAEYYIGNFAISPNLYIDYYLPATTEKRLSNVFSLSVSYSLY
jgi:hypothetical protein